MSLGPVAQPFSPIVSEAVRTYFHDAPKGAMYLKEADYGLSRMLPFLANLPNGARVLEVGSGPCILLAEITARFPQLTIQGIEPMSEGFAFFDDFINKMRAEQCRLYVHPGGYENFHQTGVWDLIFLINVFEHLPDWRDFLDFVSRSLATGGRCVVLCPNYAFPYESHFNLPVVVNKRITGLLFRKKIERFEARNDCVGLYRSLNFVRLAEVRKVAREKGLVFAVDCGVIHEMIKRLESDPMFRKRHGAIALPALLIKRMGLFGLLSNIPLLQNYLPYVQFTLSREA